MMELETPKTSNERDVISKSGEYFESTTFLLTNTDREELICSQ